MLCKVNKTKEEIIELKQMLLFPSDLFTSRYVHVTLCKVIKGNRTCFTLIRISVLT